MIKRRCFKIILERAISEFRARTDYMDYFAFIRFLNELAGYDSTKDPNWGKKLATNNPTLLTTQQRSGLVECLTLNSDAILAQANELLGIQQGNAARKQQVESIYDALGLYQRTQLRTYGQLKSLPEILRDASKWIADYITKTRKQPAAIDIPAENVA